MPDLSGAPVMAPTAPASSDAAVSVPTPVLVASGLTEDGLNALNRLQEHTATTARWYE